MPKRFRVVRGRDAWVREAAIIEVEGVETPKQAEDWARWRRNADTVEWFETGDVSTYDDTEIMEDEAEEVGPDETVDAAESRFLAPAERDTILAALRRWQQMLEQTGGALPNDLLDIATNGGTHDGLSVEDIDALCERINQ